MAASNFRLAIDVALTVQKLHDGNRREALSTMVGAVAVVCEGKQTVEWLDVAIASLQVARDIAAKRAEAAVTAATTQPLEVLS